MSGVEWASSVGSGVVALAGLVFGWATSVRSQRQTAELAREGNRHAHSLAELAGERERRLEELRHEQAARDRRDRRLEESYAEVATAVIRLSATADAVDVDELVRARVLVGLFAGSAVRVAFDHWLDQFEKLRFALSRQATADVGEESTKDLRSPRDMWRRQARDARLHEGDARERLITAMAADLDGPADPDGPAAAQHPAPEVHRGN